MKHNHIHAPVEDDRIQGENCRDETQKDGTQNAGAGSETQAQSWDKQTVLHSTVRRPNVLHSPWIWRGGCVTSTCGAVRRGHNFTFCFSACGQAGGPHKRDVAGNRNFPTAGRRSRRSQSARAPRLLTARDSPLAPPAAAPPRPAPPRTFLMAPLSPVELEQSTPRWYSVSTHAVTAKVTS